MKLLLFFVIIPFLAAFAKGKDKRVIWGLIGLCMLILSAGIYFTVQYTNHPDMYCTSIHIPTTIPPQKLVSADDYFRQGDYEYETGNCTQAIVNYSEAIKINPLFAEAYNNRAFTKMRQQNFKDALPDLNKALEIRPDYVNALMNRGDIYNYYFAIDRKAALMDYEKVIELQGMKATSVCGHSFLAKYDGWNWKSALAYPFSAIKCLLAR